jgi:hypothetical protein
MSAKVGQLRGQIQNAVASVGNTPTAEWFLLSYF